MPAMLRRLFNILSALSLVLCVLIVALAAAGRCLPYRLTVIPWQTQTHRYAIMVRPQGVGFQQSDVPPNVIPPGRMPVRPADRQTEEHLFWGRTTLAASYNASGQTVRLRSVSVYVYFGYPLFISLILPACWFVKYLRRPRKPAVALGDVAAAPASAPLECDLVCVRCGYNLRGLTRADHCPECGLGVERTVTLGRQLADSRPVWISSLARGSRLVFLSQFLVLLAIPAGLVLEVMGAATFLLLAAAIYCIGSWLLTCRENPHARRQPHRWVSISLRLFSLGLLLDVLVMTVLLAALTWWEYSRVRWSGAGSMISYGQAIEGVKLAGSLGLVAFLPCPLLQFILMRRLARRVLNRHLTEHTTIVGIGHPLSAMGFFLWVWSFPSFIGALTTLSDFYITLALTTAVVLFWLWSMYVYALFAASFRRAARSAQASWLAADAALRSPADRQTIGA